MDQAALCGAYILLEAVDSQRDGLLPRLPVVFRHGAAQVLLQLIAQLWEGLHRQRHWRRETDSLKTTTSVSRFKN